VFFCGFFLSYIFNQHNNKKLQSVLIQEEAAILSQNSISTTNAYIEEIFHKEEGIGRAIIDHGSKETILIEVW
jgi:6-phosphogluconate dehydrogenase